MLHHNISIFAHHLGGFRVCITKMVEQKLLCGGHIISNCLQCFDVMKMCTVYLQYIILWVTVMEIYCYYLVDYFTWSDFNEKFFIDIYQHLSVFGWQRQRILIRLSQWKHQGNTAYSIIPTIETYFHEIEWKPSWPFTRCYGLWMQMKWMLCHRSRLYGFFIYFVIRFKVLKQHLTLLSGFNLFDKAAYNLFMPWVYWVLSNKEKKRKWIDHCSVRLKIAKM